MVADLFHPHSDPHLSLNSKLMSVNFGGVLNGTQAFVERMISQDSPAGVVITGSKQGELLSSKDPT